MTSEASSSNSQWFERGTGSGNIKDGVVMRQGSNNNISLRTGEEFSLEFLQDRGKHGMVIGSKSDVNGQLGYKDISDMIGLQRNDYVSSNSNSNIDEMKGPITMASAPVIGSVPSLVPRASGSGVSNDSQRGKIKFLCSSGGKILPRPSDGKLRYVGGETHIFSIHKNMIYADFVKRTSEFCNQPHTIKYQLPGEDLDNLISVASDEDLQNMIEEFNGLESRDNSSRLRIFLVLLTESDSMISNEVSSNLQNNPDYQYVAAVNGIVDDGPIRNNDAELISNLDQNPNLPIKHSVSFSPVENIVTEPQIFATPSDPSFLVSPILVSNDDVINGHAQVYQDPPSESIEIPILKGRAFHSENRVLHPSDPVNPYVGSNGSQLGIPHAFSDPQLQERGSTSAFGSQDRSNFPSTMSFELPLMPAQVASSDELHVNSQPQVLFEMPTVNPSVAYTQTDYQQNVHTNVGSQNVGNFITTISTVQDHINEPAKVNRSQIPVLVSDSQLHDLQVPNILPAATATNLKPVQNPVMQPPVSNKADKYPVEGVFNRQQTASNHQQVYTGAEHGDKRSNMPSTKNMGISGMVSNHNNISDADRSLNDLLSHLTDVKLPSSHQKELTGHKNLPVGSRDGSHNVPLMQSPTTGVETRREVKVIDEKMNYTQHKVANLGHEEHHLKPLRNETDDISHSQRLGVLSSEALPSTAIEAEDALSDSGIQDTATNNESKDSSFSNALIAEMEADMYGLQIIKNAELEELKELGSGTYGTVYHGRWRGSDVAIKRIKKSCFSGRSSEQERLTNDFWREAKILSNLHHPNVVAFYGVVPDGAGGTLATVTEFMTHGSLRNVLIKKDKSLDRRRKLIIAMDAAFGMEYLHMKNIVHFDLKCDNLLVNMRDPQRPICKVGDFGLSRIKRNTLVSGGVRGTLPWMAPELLNGSTTKVSEKVDVFSFGITMWEILTGDEPYANMHCGAIIGGIVKDTLRPAVPENCDPEWKKLMEQCWSADPIIRPSFTEITNRLRTMSKALQAAANANKKAQHV
ncbi:uncharacterized protein [Rutidosis leptorrhynchoides]|uniref:uncharacterized protein n=1 Tax=Rutidosis leptorrhynchoides TaxID=125765 RepID=UPI003A99517E